MALERVADGVWLLRGDLRGAMNVYFIEDGDGVVQFDAGTKSMRKKTAAAAQELGGLKRIGLGHAPPDHPRTPPHPPRPAPTPPPPPLGSPLFSPTNEAAAAGSGKAVPPFFTLSLLEVAPVR